MGRRTHFGISAYNDKLRFNLYRRPLRRFLEDIGNVQRSQLFDLGIDLSTQTIKNTHDFEEFLSIFNTLSSLPPADIDSLYFDFVSTSNLEQELNSVTEKSKKEEEEKKLKLESSKKGTKKIRSGRFYLKKNKKI